MQEILGELLELLLNKDPSLLLEFGPLLLELQVRAVYYHWNHEHAAYAAYAELLS